MALQLSLNKSEIKATRYQARPIPFSAVSHHSENATLTGAFGRVARRCARAALSEDLTESTLEKTQALQTFCKSAKRFVPRRRPSGGRPPCRRNDHVLRSDGRRRISAISARPTRHRHQGSRRISLAHKTSAIALPKSPFSFMITARLPAL